MRALIVCNPAAGGGRGRARMERLLNDSGYPGGPPEVLWTHAAGSARELAVEACAAGAELVIAAGGDGTANEVVNGLMSVATAGRPAFGFLPLGSGCDFARTLGLPASPRDAARALHGGRDAHVDLGVVEWSGAARSEFFLNAVNVGLGPAVARRVARSRSLGRLGASAYALSTAVELFGFEPVPLRCAADAAAPDEAIALNLSICNGRYFGGGMSPAPEASVQDGLLDVVVVHTMPALQSLRLLRALMRGELGDHPRITRFRCGALRVDGPADAIEVDGELRAGLPLALSVQARGLRVRVPN